MPENWETAISKSSELREVERCTAEGSAPPRVCSGKLPGVQAGDRAAGKTQPGRGHGEFQNMVISYESELNGFVCIFHLFKKTPWRLLVASWSGSSIVTAGALVTALAQV